MRAQTTPLLCISAIEELRLAPFPDAVVHASEDVVLLPILTIFQGVRTLKDKYHVLFEPSSTPFSQSVATRNHIPLLAVVNPALDDMKREDVIRKR